jgi:hypothetical protein
MKSTNNGDTIYVLGAGASMGAKRIPGDHWTQGLKMPSASNFFADIFYLPETEHRDETYVNALGLTYENVNDFLVRAWGMKRNTRGFDIKDWQSVNIEDVFTFLDVGERMFKKGTNYHMAFQKSKDYLEDFISIIILSRCQDQRCEYLEKIFRKMSPTDTIISFNWDILADSTLDFLGNAQFTNYLKLMSEKTISISEYKKAGLFLKLHGSVNWFFCNNRSCPNYREIRLPTAANQHLPHFPGVGSFSKCERCKEESKFFLVPPVSNKVLIHQNSFLHKLWLIAREKLAYADKIVFIGYSFPSTDFYTEWLFRQINFLVGRKPEITIVNPEVKNKDSQVMKRYKTIFKDHKFQKFATLREYAEFIENGGAIHSPTTTFAKSHSKKTRRI